MKRVVYSSAQKQNCSKVTFAPSEIVELMRNIVELEGQKICYETRKDGIVDFIVNDMVYNIA